MDNFIQKKPEELKEYYNYEICTICEGFNKIS